MAHEDRAAIPRIGFTAEWAFALRDGVTDEVERRVPELLQRWPLIGFRFDAFATDGRLILILRPVPVRATPEGPSTPLVYGAEWPTLPRTAEDFDTWETSLRAQLSLRDIDLITTVPMPSEASADDFSRPHEQWDGFEEDDRRLWHASIANAFRRGLLKVVAAGPEQGAVKPARSNTPIGNPRLLAHPDFVPPTDLDQAIWRYMSMTKLMAMLEGRSVYFARADQLGDPWEGARGGANARAAAELGLQAPTATTALGEMAQRTFVSCWHAQTGESAAMWSLYAGWDALRREGLAVRSSFRSLIESLSGDDSFYAGQVSYHDYDVQYVPEDNAFVAFTRKRCSFEHEQEVRVLIARLTGPVVGGLEVPVDLGRLILEVRVAPSGPPWLRALTESILRRYDLEAPVTQSALDAEPLR